MYHYTIVEDILIILLNIWFTKMDFQRDFVLVQMDKEVKFPRLIFV